MEPSILLIVAVGFNDSKTFGTCSFIDMMVVEIHDEVELIKDSRGNHRRINNRNLKTFDVSLETSLKLCKLIPSEKIIVSESGIRSSADIKRLKSEGVNVLLIGERFMRAPEPGEELRKLLIECN
jgi:indole-3-glycerol phosphate synthase